MDRVDWIYLALIVVAFGAVFTLVEALYPTRHPPQQQWSWCLSLSEEEEFIDDERDISGSLTDRAQSGEPFNVVLENIPDAAMPRVSRHVVSLSNGVAYLAITRVEGRWKIWGAYQTIIKDSPIIPAGTVMSVGSIPETEDEPSIFIEDDRIAPVHLIIKFNADGVVVQHVASSFKTEIDLIRTLPALSVLPVNPEGDSMHQITSAAPAQ